MSLRTLYLRLSDHGDSVDWMLHSADGSHRTGNSPLSGLPDDAQSARLVVLVPATAVTIANAMLPPVKRAQQRQAALFALEDQLIDDISDLHAALGEREEQGSIPLVVVNRERLDGWLEWLAQHHLRPEYMVVDLLMLPRSDGEWPVLWEDEGVRVRTGVFSGIGFEPDQWSLLWPRLLAEAGEQQPKRLRVLDGRTNRDEPLPLDNALPEGEVVNVSGVDRLGWMTSDGALANTINLLQGDYSRREQWGRLLQPWRPAAGLFLIWLVIQGGLAIFDLRSLSQQEAQLDEQMGSLYRSSFPDARKVVDPRLQMEQKLAALKSGDSGFMKLAITASSALRNNKVKGMRYQEGALDVDVSMPDMAALDTLRASLVARGLQVEISNATQQDGKVEGRLTLRGGDA